MMKRVRFNYFSIKETTVYSLIIFLLGYVEHYLLKTAKASQLFAHQIIWNMNANMFKMYKEKGEEKMDVSESIFKICLS